MNSIEFVVDQINKGAFKYSVADHNFLRSNQTQRQRQPVRATRIRGGVKAFAESLGLPAERISSMRTGNMRVSCAVATALGYSVEYGFRNEMTYWGPPRTRARFDR